MFIGCWDCGIELTKENRTERPRIAKRDLSGYSNTISCCKDCLNKWLEKHPQYKNGN